MMLKKIIVAIGTPACRILSKYENNIPQLYIDTDSKVLEYPNSIKIGEKTCKDNNVLGDSVIAMIATQESKTKILNKLRNYSQIIILTTLGGGTSNGATLKIAEYCKSENKQVKILTNLPFYFEGRNRQLKANNYLEELKENFSVILVNYEKINTSKRQSLKDFWLEQDAKMLAEIDKIIF